MPQSTSRNTPVSEARWLFKQGFQPVRLDAGTKHPRHTGWNTAEGRFDRDHDDLEATFSGDCNLGVETGAISADLRDIDLDCPEAVAVAPAFLPPTQMVWGRYGERRHYGYLTPKLQSSKFSNPGGQTLVEIRGDRMQSMVPPSEHPDGGSVDWVTRGRPAEVESQRLLEAVHRVAATALIAQYWPKKKGQRQEFALCLSGWLAKHLQRELLLKIVVEAAKAAEDNEPQRREEAVERSWTKHHQRDDKVAGLPRLLELVPSFKPAVPLIERWLGLAALESEPTAIRIRSAQEIASKPEVTVEWYWPGWIPKDGVAVLHGPGGDRKSFLALALALSTAAGEPVFEGAPKEPGTALYVSGAGENPEWEDDRRLRRLCKGYGIDMDALPFHFITADAPLLGDAPSYNLFLEEIVRLRPRVVVLDSAIALADLKDENDNAGVRRFLQQRVVPLARQHGCTVLLIAHSAKPSPQTKGMRPVDEPRGAGEWRNAVETVISVRREPAMLNTSVVRLTKLRVGEHREQALRFTVENHERGLRVSVAPYDSLSGAVKASAAVITALEDAVAIMKEHGCMTLKDLNAALKNDGHPERARRRATDVIRGRKEWPSGQYDGKRQALVEEKGLENKSPVLFWTGSPGPEANEHKTAA
jgi:hypothetical protein